jgi:hypothetical protein
MTNIRPEVLNLLADLDPTTGDLPHQWTHRDGRPLTDFEHALAKTTTSDELRAVHTQATESLQTATAQAEALNRIQAITRPYFDRLGEGAVMRDVFPLMTDTERAEIHRLAEHAGLGTPADTDHHRLVKHIAANFSLEVQTHTRLDIGDEFTALDPADLTDAYRELGGFPFPDNEDAELGHPEWINDDGGLVFLNPDTDTATTAQIHNAMVMAAAEYLALREHALEAAEKFTALGRLLKQRQDADADEPEQP